MVRFLALSEDSPGLRFLLHLIPELVLHLGEKPCADQAFERAHERELGPERPALMWGSSALLSSLLVGQLPLVPRPPF